MTKIIADLPESLAKNYVVYYGSTEAAKAEVEKRIESSKDSETSNYWKNVLTCLQN